MEIRLEYNLPFLYIFQVIFSFSFPSIIHPTWGPVRDVQILLFRILSPYSIAKWIRRSLEMFNHLSEFFKNANQLVCLSLQNTRILWIDRERNSSDYPRNWVFDGLPNWFAVIWNSLTKSYGIWTNQRQQVFESCDTLLFWLQVVGHHIIHPF